MKSLVEVQEVSVITPGNVLEETMYQETAQLSRLRLDVVCQSPIRLYQTGTICLFLATTQENACKDAGGICADDTKCLQDGGETVSGKCPKQPSGVMCCIKTAATSEKWETFDLGKTCFCWSRTKSDAIAKAQKKESLKYENSIKTAFTKHLIPVGVHQPFQAE